MKKLILLLSISLNVGAGDSPIRAEERLILFKHYDELKYIELQIFALKELSKKKVDEIDAYLTKLKKMCDDAKMQFNNKKDGDVECVPALPSKDR